MIGIFFGGWVFGWGVGIGFWGICGIFGFVGKWRLKFGLLIIENICFI